MGKTQYTGIFIFLTNISFVDLATIDQERFTALYMDSRDTIVASNLPCIVGFFKSDVLKRKILSVAKNTFLDQITQ
jgi:hypothetical protein